MIRTRKDEVAECVRSVVDSLKVIVKDFPKSGPMDADDARIAREEIEDEIKILETLL